MTQTTTKGKAPGGTCEHCGRREDIRINLAKYLRRGEVVTLITDTAWVRYIPHFEKQMVSRIDGELAHVEVVEQTRTGAGIAYIPIKDTR